MNWPTSQDYNEAIQSAASSFVDPALQQGEATVNAIGLPTPHSGNFADVYQFKGGDGKMWAVKCFTRKVDGLRQRYLKIDEHLTKAKLPFTVGFKFFEEGIRVQGQWFPLLKMEWVEGLTLNQFIRNNAGKPQYLDALFQKWTKLTAMLRDNNFAHADLQHGNVLLVPSDSGNRLGLKLIDYDGMWVPALADTHSGEIGHPNFQHPLRLKNRLYNGDVDRFPHLVVASALRATLIGGRPLWDKFDNGDNLLFKETDLRDPANSAVFKELRNLHDDVLCTLLDSLALAAQEPLRKTPWLDDLLLEKSGPRVSADDEKQAIRSNGRSDEPDDARADLEETSSRRERGSRDEEGRRDRSFPVDDERPRRARDEYDEYDDRPRRSRDYDRPRRKKSGASQSSTAKQVAWIGPVVAIVVACVLGFVRYSVKGGLFNSSVESIPEREWKPLEQSNRFRVQLPGDPERKAVPIIPGFQMVMWEVKYGPNAVFFIGQSEGEFPAERRKLPELVLNDSCDAMKLSSAAKDNAVELRRDSIELGGFPGKRLVLDVPEKKGQLIFCIYFTGEHIYIAAAGGKGYFPEHQVVKRFFNSLEILEKRPSANPPKVALNPPDNPFNRKDDVAIQIPPAPKPFDPAPVKPVDPAPVKPVNPAPVKPFDPVPIKPVNPRPVQPAPAFPQGVRKGTGIQGPFGAEFKDGAPAGGLLVGFEFGLGRSGNSDVLKAVRPIYRVGDQESDGYKWGADFNDPVRVVAKPGYAVGAITVKSALLVDGLSITFMKVGKGGLNQRDSYQSEWIGGLGGHPPVMVGGDAMLVTGIKGRMKDKNLSGIGLLQGEKLGPGDRPGIKPTEVRGGPFDPELRDATENNDLLVGLEIGLGKFFQNDVIHGIRPVYQSGEKQTFGKRWGKNIYKNVKVIAKPGYAIGAMTLKTGLGLDGMSVTFMKVANGQLDPSDAYESEWIGGMGGGPPGKVGGDGAAYVGIVLKINRDGDVSGLGLLQIPDSNDK